ncbi:MAG: DUF4406 domain-containing protein [Treponema sp.]|nr:DUF4406 domain-containing protein [Treponema sp.]
MKAFISQPMKGKSRELIREERAALKATLEAEGHEVIDSVLPSAPNDGGETPEKSALRCLSASLAMLCEADLAYFMDGWENARGCRIEHDCCEAYGIPIRHESDRGD